MPTPKIPMRLSARDLSEKGVVSPERLAEVLNTSRDSVREVSETRRLQTVELSVLTASVIGNTFPLPPIKLADNMPDTPREVRVGYVENITSPSTAFTSGVFASWQPAPGRQLVVKYITGLSTSTRYTIRLIIEG